MKIFIENYFKFAFSVIGFIFLAVIVIANPYQANSENFSKLKTPLVNINFDNKDGLPLSYELLKLKEYFKGKSEGQSIKIILRNIQSRTDTSITPVLKNIEISAKQANVRYAGYLNESKVVDFTLRYAVQGFSVLMTMENVNELNGYVLIEIQTNSLVTVKDVTGNEWVAHGDGGGVYAKLKDAKPCELKDGWMPGWMDFPNFTYLPLVLMGNGKVNCSMEVLGYLCNTRLLVSVTDGQKKYTTMGARSYYRVRGGKTTPDILAEQKEICRLDFTTDYDNNKITDWLDAAKSVRDRMPPIPTHYFDNRMAWIIMGQAGRAGKVNISFPDISKVIKRISLLTAGVSQAVYIAGWTEGGHDTGYPNVTELNKKMGGFEGFSELKKQALKFDANISFDNMYDDQYDNEYSKGYYNEKYIARDRDGQLMKFRAWNGLDTCRISGMAKYMQDGGSGIQRIQYTVKKYGIKNTELVDGLSWMTVRHDWDPNQPASAVKNLREGKFKLISEYKKLGVHIISEMLRYPVVGHLALVVDGPTGLDWCWNEFGGTAVPIMRIVYSKSIIYGPPGGGGPERDPRIVLLDNNRRGPWIDENMPDTQITDYYYLNFLPWTKLHELDVLSFDRINQTVNMELSNNSKVVIDYSKPDSFTAVYNGKQIMNGYSITCPIDKKKIAFYSKSEKTLKYPVPDTKNKAQFQAKVLLKDRSENFPFKIINGNIEISVPANRPVIFYY